MSLFSKNSGGDFRQLPSGTHLACCYLLVDIGIQESSFGTKPQVAIGFEVPAEPTDDGRPMIIYRILTNSMHEKSTLRKLIESWRGKKLSEAEAERFDLRAILGKHCQLSVVHDERNGRTYANIAAITGLPKGLPVPARVNDLICFDIDEPQHLELVPEWLRKKIAAARIAEEFNDDMPFADHDERNPPPIDDWNVGTPPPIDDFNDDIPF